MWCMGSMHTAVSRSVCEGEELFMKGETFEDGKGKKDLSGDCPVLGSGHAAVQGMQRRIPFTGPGTTMRARKGGRAQTFSTWGS